VSCCVAPSLSSLGVFNSLVSCVFYHDVLFPPPSSAGAAPNMYPKPRKSSMVHHPSIPLYKHPPYPQTHDGTGFSRPDLLRRTTSLVPLTTSPPLSQRTVTRPHFILSKTSNPVTPI
jgi:hypothetical protein